MGFASLFVSFVGMLVNFPHIVHTVQGWAMICQLACINTVSFRLWSFRKCCYFEWFMLLIFWCMGASYEYVDDYRRTHHRPAVWMPRPCEFTHNGRDDIRQAISRFGGASRISRVAGMVSYQEWFYFDGQLELFTELRRYLDENADGDYEVFPSATAVKKHGFDRLYGLIQYYGGRRFVAARLGMKIPASSSGSSNLDTASFHDQLNWGPFDLDFAVRLLLCIREGHIQRNPPLVNPTLSIPSAQRLRQSIHEEEDVWLEDKIQQYGGRENVARRLGLAFSSERKS